MFNSRRQKLILAKHKEDKSYSDITSIVRRSKSVVYRVISRFKRDKTHEPKLRTSRPPMTTKRVDQMIVKMSLKDRLDTTTSISRALCKQPGKPISRKTVSHRLNYETFVARIPCRKPLISKKNQKFRVDFATEHIMWREKQWNMVPCNDEYKFNLFGSDGKRFVRHKNRKRLSPHRDKKL